jgi:nitric oxide reductase NorF protein
MILSAASVLAASSAGMNFGPGVAGAFIVLFAWLKTRIILARYLGLWRAPGWLAGFNWVLAFYCLLLFGLYLAPEFSR